MSRWSRPARARGLKLAGLGSEPGPGQVAPRAGAWIETGMNLSLILVLLVAPRAGAWIETCVERGLAPPDRVAPRAGAWIET